MLTRILGWTVAAVFLSTSIAEAGSLPLDGTPNPDPAAISLARHTLIEVRATGGVEVVEHPLATFSPYKEEMSVGDWPITFDATADVRNVQWAVQNVPAGGTVRLKSGPHGEAFNFGGSAIFLPGINLVGAGFDERGNPRTTIENGSEPIRPRFPIPGDTVRIDGLWFRSSKGHSITSAYASYARLEITNNKFTDARAQYAAAYGLYFTQALGANSCTIDDIVLSGNDVDALAAPVTDGGDTALEVYHCHYKSITVTDNILKTQGLGLELLGNRGADGDIVVRRNSIEGIGEAGTNTIAIFVADNEGARVTIAQNRLNLTNLTPFVMSHDTPDAAFVVEDNETTTVQTPLAAMYLGLPGIPDGESPLSGARIAHNKFSGDAPFGIVAYDLPDNPYGGPPFINRSSGNLFLRNDFEHLSVPAPPDGCRVRLDASTSNNVFKNNKGLALDCNLGTNNRIVDRDDD